MQARAILAFVVGLLLTAGVSQANVIQIQLGGINLCYDGTDIMDAGIQNPDPLTNATFIADVTLGSDNTGVTLDLHIPDVSNILVGGGQVNSAANGSLYLDLGDGEFLSLTLDSTVITYFPMTSTITFVFAGVSSLIGGQNLPYGLSLVDPVSVSFSTQITAPISESGGYVTAFSSAGTGEIQGVPEPATLGLLAMGGLALIRRRRK